MNCCAGPGIRPDSRNEASVPLAGHLNCSLEQRNLSFGELLFIKTEVLARLSLKIKSLLVRYLPPFVMKFHLIFLLVLAPGLMLMATPQNQTIHEKYAAESGESILETVQASSQIVVFRSDASASDFSPLVIDQSLSASQETDDLYLPVSSTSEEAIAAYQASMDLARNAHFDSYFEKLEEAAEIDPEFFMSYAHRSMTLVAFGQHGVAEKLIDQAVALCSDQMTRSEQILCKLMSQWDKSSEASAASVLEELTAAYPENIHAYEIASVFMTWIDQDHEKARAAMEESEN